MKSFSFAACLILLFYSQFSNSMPPNFGTEGGNGGDSIALEFLHIASEVVSDIKNDDLHFPELKNKDLVFFLKNVKVLTTENSLPLSIDGIVQNSTAINYPSQNLIVINRDKWLSIQEKSQKLTLAFHELLGLLGLEKSGEYPISSRYAHLDYSYGNELLITGKPLSIVPSETKSCYARRKGLNRLDVSSSYLAIPRISIYRSNPENDLFIIAVSVYFTALTTGQPETSIFNISGNELLALNFNWWKRQNAIIPKKISSDDFFSTDCPLVFGGIAWDNHTKYYDSALIKVIGVEVNRKTGEEYPVDIKRSISVRFPTP